MWFRWRWRPVEALLGLCLAASALAEPAAPRLPDAAAAALGDPVLHGRASFRWMGFDLYYASLWTAGRGWSEASRFALDIRYTRRITGAQLASSSADEMRRMGYRNEAKLAQWERAMMRLFPDVGPGDRLIGIHVPGGGARFFSGDRVLGDVDDPEFSRAFFQIWLGERTRKRDLRNALLGRHDGAL